MSPSSASRFVEREQPVRRLSLGGFTLPESAAGAPPSQLHSSSPTRSSSSRSSPELYDEAQTNYQPLLQSMGASSAVPTPEQTTVPLRSIFSLPIPLSRALLVRYITELGIHSPAAGVALFDSLLSGTSTSRTSLLSSLAGLNGAGITLQLGNRSASPGPARIVGDYLIGDNAEISTLIAQLFAVDNSSRDRSTAKSVVESLRRVDPSSLPLDNSGRSEECSICQEIFVASGSSSSSASGGDDVSAGQEGCSGVAVLELPCFHHFHHECVLPWLDQHNTCPSCRAELPTDDSEYNKRKGLTGNDEVLSVEGGGGIA